MTTETYAADAQYITRPRPEPKLGAFALTYAVSPGARHSTICVVGTADEVAEARRGVDRPAERWAQLWTTYLAASGSVQWQRVDMGWTGSDWQASWLREHAEKTAEWERGLA